MFVDRAYSGADMFVLSEAPKFQGSFPNFKHFFKGCFSKDQVPASLCDPRGFGTFIWNTKTEREARNSPGHWVSFTWDARENETKLLGYDSTKEYLMGARAEQAQFISDFHHFTQKNPDGHQNPGTNTCGLWSLCSCIEDYLNFTSAKSTDAIRFVKLFNACVNDEDLFNLVVEFFGVDSLMGIFSEDNDETTIAI